MQTFGLLLLLTAVATAANIAVASSGKGTYHSSTGSPHTLSSDNDTASHSSHGSTTSSATAGRMESTTGSARRVHAAPRTTPPVPKHSTAALAAEEATELNAHASITSGSGKSSGRRYRY